MIVHRVKLNGDTLTHEEGSESYTLYTRNMLPHSDQVNNLQQHLPRNIWELLE